MMSKAMVVGVAILLALAGQAGAGNYYWDGNGGVGDSNWSTAANWNPDGAPPSGADHWLWFVTASKQVNTNDYATGSFGRINFQSGGFDLQGNALSLTDTSVAVHNHAGSNTINFGMTMTGSATDIGFGVLNAGGLLTLNGNIAAKNNATISLQNTASNSQIRVTGNMSCGSNVWVNLYAPDNTVTTYLSGNNSGISSIGATSLAVVAGLLKVEGSNTNVLGTKIATLMAQLGSANFGTIDLNGVNVVNSEFRMNWTGTGSLMSTPVLTNSSDTAITLAGTLYFRRAMEGIVNVQAGDITFNGEVVVADAVNRYSLGSTLHKTGTGLLTFNKATNGYLGTLKVSNGTLLLNGAFDDIAGFTISGGKLALGAGVTASKPITFTSGSIGGNGTFAQAGGVTVPADGTLEPGLSPGVTTFSTGLTLTGGYVWELNAKTTGQGPAPDYTFDQALVTGGSLDIAAEAWFAPSFLGAGVAPSADVFWSSPHDWVIIDSATADENFVQDNVANDPAWVTFGQFSTSNVAGDVILHWEPVPEPATLGFLALGGLSMLGAAIRRRRLA